MKKIVYLIPVALLSFLMTSCDLNYFPSDELNADSFLQTEEGAEAIIDGCYSMLKDETDHLNYKDGNTYIRHYTQLTEFPSDNICNSNRTTDPLYEANTLTMSSTLNNIGVLWWTAYKICFSVNTVIEKYKEGTSTAQDHLIGEAYFLRGMMHLHIVTLCAKPYVMGRDQMGVVIRTSTNTNETSRATVGECYDQIVADLQKAASLMGTSRGNAGYACKNTALGLLSRVYLYMGEYDKVVATVQQMGVTDAGSADAVLDKDFVNYFRNALSSKESLFCVAHTALETRSTGSIGSMYINDVQGWGEIYPSDPLLNLYERYPSDLRYSSYIHPQIYSTAKKFIYFPGIVDKSSRFSFALEVKGDAATGYSFVESGKTYKVQTKIVNGEYPQYYVNYNGEDLDARIMPQMLMAPNGGAVPMYYVSKFSYQDNDPMLSSPVLLRWGEVVLNLAEAYTYTGKADEALKIVNVVRRRANIPEEGMFSAANMHGYPSALEVVLDERRMELAFEGHRMFDLIRNKQAMDRRYSGVQFWEVINYDNPRIQYPIPYEEVSTSGIPQNPGY